MYNLEELKNIKNVIRKNQTISFVSGNFNILHAGHQRLLRFAKENADILVVGVNKIDINTSLIAEELRLEGIKNSIFVDYALIIEDSLDVIKYLKPNIIIKGKEHENNTNPEEEILKEYGGKLIFTSGTIGFSSLELLKNEFKNIELSTIHKPMEYFLRHDLNTDELVSTIESFKDLNIAVIGDTIVDEYIICDPIGMSQEDPTIVVTPISNDFFVGGAGIVASHAAGLGASVDYFSILGCDKIAQYVKDEIKVSNVNGYFYSDNTRPTTLKQRFRANDKTLLRVNHLKSHAVEKEIQDNLVDDFKKEMHKYDLVIFSDFSYGCVPKRLVEIITDLCNSKNINISADSQSSSQMGDILKFRDINLLTPTEREARLGVNDFESGLIILSDKIQKETNSKYLITTLGKEGVLIFAGRNSNGDMLVDRLPAMNSIVKDPSGAGDSLLISSSMVLSLGKSIWESAYIGSLCAAIQVSRVGNIPITKEEVIKELKI